MAYFGSDRRERKSQELCTKCHGPEAKAVPGRTCCERKLDALARGSDLKVSEFGPACPRCYPRHEGDCILPDACYMLRQPT